MWINKKRTLLNHLNRGKKKGKKSKMPLLPEVVEAKIQVCTTTFIGIDTSKTYNIL